MKVNFTLETADFLEHQLFVASISDTVRKQRLKTRIGIPISYMLIGLVMSIYKKDLVPVIIFAAIAVAWFFLYPIRDRKRYEKHYRNYVNENAKDMVGKPHEVAFEAGVIRQSSEAGEARVNMTDVKEIYELKTIIMIRLKSGGSLVIPKLRIENLEALRSYLQEMALEMDLRFSINDQWEWK